MTQGQFTDYLYADKRVIRAGGSGYRQCSARSELWLEHCNYGGLVTVVDEPGGGAGTTVTAGVVWCSSVQERQPFAMTQAPRHISMIKPRERIESMVHTGMGR